MSPSVASLICACGIAGLFYLDRDRSVRVSKSLWLPGIYLWLIGSRSVSAWLGVTQPAGTNVQIEGSPLDAAVFALLLVGAITVLCGRGKQTRALLAENWPVLLYYSYCLISISWAHDPGVALKKWIKSIDDLAMVLVIVTDRHPIAALTRVVSRVGFLVLPISVLFIKYYGNLGRAYSPDGGLMNTGVSTNKNSLGLIVLVISLVVLWNVRALFRNKEVRNRLRRLVGQTALLAFGFALLKMANSATCVACFCLCGSLIFATGLRAIRNRTARVHALCLGIFFAGALLTLLGGQSVVTGALGRQSNFTGRTDIWAAVIPAVSNPIVGDGYESFWIGPGQAKVSRTLALKGWWHPEALNEAHDGYLEVYLNLGCIGVGLVLVILISGYSRAVAAFRVNPAIGSLMLAFVVSSAFYSITEAGFRPLDLMWIFLLIGIFGASGAADGLVGWGKTRILVSSAGQDCIANAIPIRDLR